MHIVGNTNPALTTVGLAGSTLTLTPVANANGFADVTVRATDSAGLFAEDTFRLTVTPGNDPPTLAVPIPDRAATAGTGFAFQFAANTFADIDAGDVLTFTTSALPGWLTFNPATRTFSDTPTNADVGFVDVTVTARDTGNATAADTFRITVAAGTPPPPPVSPPPVSPPPAGPPPVSPPPVTAPLSRTFSAGGPSTVRSFNANGTERATFTPFPGFAGGVRTAEADFNRDGVADVLAGTGPGTEARVRLLDGVTGAELFSIAPFAGFVGGVFLAAGDLTGDGTADIVITPDEGGGPRVRVFDGRTFTQVADFFGIDDPAFRGGARATTGDFNGDGSADLVVAAGFGGGPRVALFEGKALTAGATVHMIPDFFAFEQGLRNGAFVAAGDVNGDGRADFIGGGGPGGGPRVKIVDGAGLLKAGNVSDLDQRLDLGLANFFGGDPASRGGIRVSVTNLDGDARADLEPVMNLT